MRQKMLAVEILLSQTDCMPTREPTAYLQARRMGWVKVRASLAQLRPISAAGHLSEVAD